MTSPVLMPAGHAIVAADLDAYENLTGVWGTYTPVWSSSGTQPAIVNGAIIGHYVQVGQFIVAAVRIIMGSGTTYGTGDYSVSLPSTAQGSLVGAGSCFISDSGTGVRAASVGFAGSASAVRLAGSAAGLSATSPITFTTSDEILLAIVYQEA